jgi:hypothetical protein
MELKKQDADFRLQANFKSKNGCKVEHAVRLARVGKLKIDNAPLLTCSMATQLVKFEKESIQPIAKRIFGSEAKRLSTSVHIIVDQCANTKVSSVNMLLQMPLMCQDLFLETASQSQCKGIGMLVVPNLSS